MGAPSAQPLCYRAYMSRCAACGDEHDPQLTRCPRLDVPVTDGPCGTRIERYDVERFVGGGGFGAVYVARHSLLGQPVAMKLLRREVAGNAEVVARFLREARAAASIHSPHVVRVTDFGTTTDGTPFFVMDLLAGRDLETLLRSERALAVPRAVELALQCLDGLAAAHAIGVIHRDVKPANIVLSSERGPNGGRDHVVVVDFGLSKVTLAGGAQALTLTGAIIGTPHYMPPEQFHGTRDVDARADLYAMGVILYQLLSGALPYDAPTSGELLVKICSEPPRPLREVAPSLPEALLEVVGRAMAAEPDARFQTAQAFADALRTALTAAAHAPATAPAQARGAVPHQALAQPATSPRSRRGLLAAGLVVVPLLLVGLACVGWFAATRVLPLLGDAPGATSAAGGPRLGAAPTLVAALADAPTRIAEPPDAGAPVDPLAALDALDALVERGNLAAVEDAGVATGVPPLAGLLALSGMLGGIDPHGLARLQQGQQPDQDPLLVSLDPISDGPARLSAAHLVHVSLRDRPRFIADLHRVLERLARCPARPADAHVVVQLAVQPPRRPFVTVVPSSTGDAAPTRCVSESLRGIDLVGNLTSRTGGAAMLEFELPVR